MFLNFQSWTICNWNLFFLFLCLISLYYLFISFFITFCLLFYPSHRPLLFFLSRYLPSSQSLSISFLLSFFQSVNFLCLTSFFLKFLLHSLILSLSLSISFSILIYSIISVRSTSWRHPSYYGLCCSNRRGDSWRNAPCFGITSLSMAISSFFRTFMASSWRLCQRWLPDDSCQWSCWSEVRNDNYPIIR